MPTYREAAASAFKRVVDLIGDYSVLANAGNGYWHMANTLDTCVQYLLVSQTGNNLDTYGLVQNALDKVFDFRMSELVNGKRVPVDPKRWGPWSRNKGEGGPWADDYGWWGMALARAYRNRERLGYDSTFSTRIYTYARNAFTGLAYGWDPSEAVPGSGVYGGAWNHEDTSQAMTGRNSVTNEVLWIFAQLMWDLEKNPIYQFQMTASQKFFFDAKAKKFSDNGALLTEDGLVRERLLGMDNGYPYWTWAGDQGLFMGACLGHEGNSPNAPLALALAKVVTAKLLDSKSPDGVLHDNIAPNSDFNDDYATGKGAFMRMWTYFNTDLSPPPPNYLDLIVANATAVWNNRPTPDAPGNAQYQFGFNWNPTGKPVKDGGEPTYPGGTTDPSTFSLLVCQVAGLAAFNAICLQSQIADKQIPAKKPALVG
jgi:hypothetical protein